jgi:hypothetical protein
VITKQTLSQLSVNVKSYPVTALKGDKMTEVRKPSYRLTFYDAVPRTRGAEPRPDR